MAVNEYRQEQGIWEPIMPVPSDHITTCRADPLGSINEDWLYRTKKHLVTRVSSIGGAFWQKALTL